MNFRHLEIFRAIMATGTTSEAANVLGLSQPAVSVILKHAESQLGIKLFERARGRLHPTPEAKALMPDVDWIFSRMDNLKRYANELRDGHSGFLAVSAPPQIAAAFLSKAISTFCANRPEVRINMRSAPTAEVIDIVLRQQVDLGLVYAPYGNKVTVARQIGITEIACAMHPNHDLTASSIVTPAELLQHRIISYRPETPLRKCIDRAFKNSGTRLKVHIETSTLCACALAMEGAGIALIDPLIMTGNMFHGLVLRPFRPLSRLGVQLISPRDRPLSRLAQQFASHLELIGCGVRVSV